MLITSRRVNCPNCGVPQEVSMYETVNVTAEPAFKDQIFRRALNHTECPHCQSEILSELLYYDRSRNFMISLRPDGDRTGEELSRRKVRLIVEDMTLRIVHQYDDLIEKIRIFENKLDDCLIEFLKLTLWPKIASRKKARLPGNEIRLIGMTWPHLLFQLTLDGRRKEILLPYEDYLKCGPCVAPAKREICRGSWIVVDRRFISENVSEKSFAEGEKIGEKRLSISSIRRRLFA